MRRSRFVALALTAACLWTAPAAYAEEATPQPTEQPTAQATATPTPTAAAEPTPTPTAEPSPRPTATAEPTRSPRARSRETSRPRRAAAPTERSRPRSTADEEPTRTSSHGSEPTQEELDRAAAEEQLQESTQAVVDAMVALTSAERDLLAVQAQAETARALLAQARTELARAEAELAATNEAVAAAERQITGVRGRIAETEEDLSTLARTAYQRGQLAELSVVLGAQTPDDFASRLAYVRSVVDSGNGALATLADSRADLDALHLRLRALQAQQQVQKATAATRLAATQKLEREAAALERRAAAIVAERTAALAMAEESRAEDLRRYGVYQAESARLGESIPRLAARLAEARGPSVAVSATGFGRPATGRVTSPFGPRLHPILGYVKVHTGTDFSRGDGYVYAAADGVVLETSRNRAYGNMTVVDHGTMRGDRVSTLYAHQARFLVEPGDRVRRGEVIGVIGSTGYSTGPHLHFEVRLDGDPVDPWPYVRSAPSPR